MVGDTGASAHPGQWAELDPLDMAARTLAAEVRHGTDASPAQLKAQMVGVMQVARARAADWYGGDFGYAITEENAFVLTSNVDPNGQAARQRWSDPVNGTSSTDYSDRYRYELGLKVAIGVSNGWLEDAGTVGYHFFTNNDAHTHLYFYNSDSPDSGVWR